METKLEIKLGNSEQWCRLYVLPKGNQLTITEVLEMVGWSSLK